MPEKPIFRFEQSSGHIFFGLLIRELQP